MKKIQIQGVSETMLQTLYARAAYSKQKNAKIHDSKAVEIVSRMDYDFSFAGDDALMSKGVIARTILLDRMVGDFIRENPNATVINIACGMDTRAYRLKIGSAVRWYNIDFPETIEVRSSFLEENGHISMIAKSAMDERWADKKTVQSEQYGRNGTDKRQFFLYAGLRNVGKAAFFNQHRLA